MRDVRLGQRHLCGSCRYEAAQERREHPEPPSTGTGGEDHDGSSSAPAPNWWEADGDRHVVKYTNAETLREEAVLAERRGWRAVSEDNFGDRARRRSGVPAVRVALRALGSVTVVWERSADPPPEPVESPIETLRQLKELLELDLIAHDEYERKKADVLARM